MSTFLDNSSSYLFIFSPSIGLQLICPCANIPVVVPLETPERLWFPSVSSGCEIGVLVMFGSSNDDLI